MPYSQEQRDIAVEIAQQYDQVSEEVMVEIRAALGVGRMSAKTVRRWLADKDVLNDREQAFVYFYLQCFNQTKAAQLAGYAMNSAYSQGHVLMKKPEIRARIDAELNKYAMSAGEVLARLAEHGRGDITEFITLSEAELEDHPKSFLLKKYKRKVTTDKDGNSEQTFEFEIHDPQAALVHIGRHHKLFTDKTELAGEDGKPIAIAVTKMDVDEL